MTTDEAGLLIATLAAAYPRQTLEPTTIEVYARSLTDLNPDLATNAVMRLIASSVFFPSIAEIRTAAAETATQLPTATEAWMLVNSEQGRASAPPEVREALYAVGGSWAVRTSENPTTLHAQFRDAYKDIRRRALDAIVYAGCPTPELEEERRERLALRESSLYDDARFVRTDAELVEQ